MDFFHRQEFRLVTWGELNSVVVECVLSIYIAYFAAACRCRSPRPTGFKLIIKTRLLNLNYPSNYPFDLGQAHFLLHRYEDTVAAFQSSIDTNPASERSRVWLAVTYGQAGLVDDAEFETEEILALDPDFSIRRVRENVPLKDSSDIEHFIGGLRKAGLPE